MPGETNLAKLLATLEPHLNEGDYVYCTIPDASHIDLTDAILYFRETEGLTLILPKEKADALHLTYEYIAAWITLSVHSSLEAVGLTAAFSKALTGAGISCNVIAGYYHDHIFVAKPDAQRSMAVLKSLR